MEINSRISMKHSSRAERLMQRIWECFRFLPLRFSPWFATRWRVACINLGQYLYRPSHVGTVIAWSSSVARTSCIDFPWRVSVGAYSSIGERTWVYAKEAIHIGKNVCIGNDVKLLTGTHDITSRHFDFLAKPICIEDNAWIATGSMVLPGVVIGEGAVIAAGSVVTKNVEPWTVVGGNPARFIKKRILKESK